MRPIHGLAVYGKTLDDETRCAHYGGPADIIAIRFKCCDRWYPCHECHAAESDHQARNWPTAEFDERAILCGFCGQQLTVNEYLSCDSTCPGCGSKFNPGCAKHLHLYFET